MKRINFISTLLFLVFFDIQVFGQVVITRTDTFRLSNDGLLFRVDEYRGEILWQYSSDFYQWTDMPGQTSNSFLFENGDSKGWFRAKITEGTCLPVYSDTVSIQATNPIVTTLGVENISTSSATVIGEIMDNGGAEIFESGICYDTIPNPTVQSGKTTDGSAAGQFASDLSGLEDGVDYYVRAYATNSKGTGYGNELNFQTEGSIFGTFTDPRDERTYPTIKLGNQRWMAENLAYHMEEGCWAYGNNESNVEHNGRLYTWDSANKACPDGWHLPSDEEWKELEMHLGMTQDEANMTNTWRGTPVGTMLKKGGSSGFNSPLAGRRTPSGGYAYLGEWEYVWSSTPYGSNYAWRRCLAHNFSSVGRYNTFTKNYGFSVRCVQDD